MKIYNILFTGKQEGKPSTIDALLDTYIMLFLTCVPIYLVGCSGYILNWIIDKF